MSLYPQQQENPAGLGDEKSYAVDVTQNKTGEIVGTVIDAGTRQPLEGVTVEIPGSEYSVQTGKEGTYSLSGVNIGIYQVQASKPGYSPQTESQVRVKGGDRLTVFFGMKKESEDIQQPVPVHHPAPVYPEVMRRAGIQGIIFIQLTVSEQGEVTSAVVEQSRFTGPAGEQLDANRTNYKPMEESALAAARQWKFTPAMKSGKPVRTILTLPIKFKLDSSKSSGGKKLK
jgi:TonB family protein